MRLLPLGTAYRSCSLKLRKIKVGTDNGVAVFKKQGIMPAHITIAARIQIVLQRNTSQLTGGYRWIFSRLRI